MIACEVCGKAMEVISWKHLATHGMTLDDYRTQFPTSPVKSAAAIQRKRESATRANASRVGVPRSLDVVDKIKTSKAANPVDAWNKGVPRSQEQNRRLSDTRKHLFSTGDIVHWNTGRSTSDATKSKISSTLLSHRRVYSDASKHKRLTTINYKKSNGWVHHSTESLIARLSPTSQSLLNDRDWLYDQHITNQRTVASICVELGLHWKHSNRTVRTRLEKFGIPIQYWHQASSAQQRDLEDFITSLGVDIDTRNRTLIAPLELDIVVPSRNIAIEYCGLYWHTTEYKDRDYHIRKYEECAKLGIRLLTIYSDEWLNNRPLVEAKLKNILGKSTGAKVFARQCVVDEVSSITKKEFFDRHHLQGNGPSSINIGLYHDGMLVACAGFIHNSPGRYTLNRYATSDMVVGGLGKLLSHFVKHYHPDEIITFADRRWSVGGVYDVVGFVVDAVIPADYEYVVGETRIHKFNYRHKHLARLLPMYDSAKTEVENTALANIYQIYDCGKIRYRWSPPTQ